MTPVRWNRAKQFNYWEKEMENMFNTFNTGRLDKTGKQATSSFVPAADVREMDEAFQISLDLPGVDKKDITIDISDGVLTIKGEKKKEHNSDGEGWYHRERVYGTFEKRFDVSHTINADAIKAAYDNGVLTVQLPKAEEAKAKQITIQ